MKNKMEIEYKFELDTSIFDEFKEDIKSYSKEEINKFDNIQGSLAEKFFIETEIKGSIIICKVVPKQGLQEILDAIKRKRTARELLIKEAFIKENEESYKTYKAKML